MKKITPIETFRNAISRAPLLSVLPTSFRKPFSLSLQVELCELLTRLHRDYGINLSQEFEPLIRRRAKKLAKAFNKQVQSINKKAQAKVAGKTNEN